MKKLLLPANATFNAAARTITFANTIPASISAILHVCNITRGVIIFQPQAGYSYSGTYASPVLTLSYDTSGHDNSDKLEIFYDDNAEPATSAKQPALGTAGAPSADVLTVQGNSYKSVVTVQRAANTTAYTAGDVVGGVLTIPTIGPANGRIFLTDVRLMLNVTAVPSGIGTFTLHLFSSSPNSAIADNSPFTLPSNDRASYLGSVAIGTPALVGTGTGTPFVELSWVNKGVTMPAGTSLYGYLVTSGALVPAANSETYTITVLSVAP